MEKIFFIWLASIPLWMVLVAGFLLAKKLKALWSGFWNKKSNQVKRKLYYDIGLVLTGSGGVGAFLGITSQTTELELQLRLVGAITLIIVGVIIALLNMED